MCVRIYLCGLLVLWPSAWSAEGHSGTEDWWMGVSPGGVAPWILSAVVGSVPTEVPFRASGHTRALQEELDTLLSRAAMLIP